MIIAIANKRFRFEVNATGFGISAQTQAIESRIAKTTEELIYVADGSGADATPILFATVRPGTVLTAADFELLDSGFGDARKVTFDQAMTEMSRLSMTDLASNEYLSSDFPVSSSGKPFTNYLCWPTVASDEEHFWSWPFRQAEVFVAQFRATTLPLASPLDKIYESQVITLGLT